jgi:hypothetical protein
MFFTILQECVPLTGPERTFPPALDNWYFADEPEVLGLEAGPADVEGAGAEAEAEADVS